MADDSAAGHRRTSDADDPTIATHCCSADRTVFVEEGRRDAWIATDHTVRIEP
ncbi:MAG: hypothetical protein ACOCYZ_03515 [Halococcoides sp.]